MICYEQLGQGNAGELQKRGVTPEHLLRHFMLRNEFIFRKCKKYFRDGDLTANIGSDDENAEKCTRVMTVLDVKGIKFSDFSGDVLRSIYCIFVCNSTLRFIQLSAEVMDNHYPGCVIRLVICNTPSWFFSIWSVIAR
jgi:hypothetical protein